MGFVTFMSFDDILSISHKKSIEKSIFSPEISLRAAVTFFMVRSVFPSPTLGYATLSAFTDSLLLPTLGTLSLLLGLLFNLLQLRRSVVNFFADFVNTYTLLLSYFETVNKNGCVYHSILYPVHVYS